MNIRPTVLVIGAITVTTAVGIALGTAMWPGATPDPVPVTIDLGERHTQLARLANDPDIDPALLGLLRGLQQDLQTQQEAVKRLAVELAAVQRERLALAGLGEEEGEASTDSSPDRSAADAPPEAGMQLRGRRGAVSEERLTAAGFAA
ncbi:MAG: hypothetical protein OES38_23710, partial [Gammaproteobacteria bacterium]|nr:hypothetical protein [Gammaproteobacteria bacterium]